MSEVESKESDELIRLRASSQRLTEALKKAKDALERHNELEHARPGVVLDDECHFDFVATLAMISAALTESGGRRGMRYTVVSNGGMSYAVRGTKTRDEAVSDAREAMQAEYTRLKQFLALPVEQYEVRVVDGLHAERLIREL